MTPTSTANSKAFPNGDRSAGWIRRGFKAIWRSRCWVWRLLPLVTLFLVDVPAVTPLMEPGSSREFFYQNDVIPEVPWSVHLVGIDRRRRDLVLTTSLGAGHRIGKATL